jgi:DNA polymerase-3 subunit epsilon
VINDFADMFENLNKNITEQILIARKDTEKERNLLAAIMAELPQGVIICNKSGRILLFNSLAKKIFTQETHSKRAEHFIGLGRSIFHIIDKDLIVHAVKEIEDKLNTADQSMASYFITPIYTGRLISIETIPVLDQDNLMTGFILTFQDVSEDIDRYEAIDQRLLAFKKDLDKTLDPEGHPVLNGSDGPSLSAVIEGINQDYNHLCRFILDSTLNKLPLTTLSLNHFLSSIENKIRLEQGIRLHVAKDEQDVRFLADTYSFTMAFIFLIINLSEHTLQKEFNLKISHSKTDLFFDIIWDKPVVDKLWIKNMITRKIRSLPSFGYVLQQNRSEFVIPSASDHTCSQVRIKAGLQLSPSVTKGKRPAVITASRPEFYDFNLFNIQDANLDLLETNLKDIIYTVFDTETTGLSPEGGDEIISIGAVRIVNNRIAYQDIFEELIDPKRDIPIESYNIHGISYEMLLDKPDINKILPVFKKYTQDTVLLGHNIAFDMKMLKVKEKTSQIYFENPVLDTLLLSAMLHPIHEKHDMESIAKRLGVNIIGRHTALGDAIATAEIFLKLVPILNSNGILTLKDAVTASQKTYYARLKY